MKPGLFKNEVLGAADPLFSLIYAGLWCLADCEGRLEDRPARIHIELNPWRAIADTQRALNWLAEQVFIVRYEVEGERYLWIPKFRKHQSPHVKEIQKGSKIPQFVEQVGTAPGQHQTGTLPAPGQHQTGPSDSGFLNPDSGFLKSDSPFPIPDSGLPPAAGADRQAAPASRASEEEVQKALKLTRNPKHRDFSAHDIAKLGVSLEAAKEAKRRMQTSAQPRRAMQ